MGSARILITGANGQVGRACVAALTRAGLDVVAVAGSVAGGRQAIDLSQPFEAGLAQIGDAGFSPPSAIVHLAAAVPHDSRYPDNLHSAGLTEAIDRHVHQAAAAWGCRVVYMSTCAVYDRADPAIKSSCSSLAASLSPYAAAKRAGELLFADLGAAVLRLSAPAGAHSRSNLVFGRFAERCRAGGRIELWGRGAREQDFIDLDDVCDLILAAVRNEVVGTFNCASGRAVTMAELAETIVRFYGRGSITYAPRPDPLEGETARFDIADTMRAFGWAPRRGLCDMLRSLESAHSERL